ncbi:MAG: hypothetical protein GWN86_16175, partial [Desulfobacterales bacterium]|nr:hypothetical protein [Desulfobacterales bacterium]
NIVGLNIKGSSVRAAFIQRRFGLTTKHLGEASLDLPAGREERRAILTGALEEWSREYGIKGVVVGLDLSRFSHHIVQVPVTAKE